MVAIESLLGKTWAVINISIVTMNQKLIAGIMANILEGNG